MAKEQQQSRGTGHRQRLRERFLENGLNGLGEAEILELLLSFGTPRKDCKLQARALLKHFHTVSGVLDATNLQLQAIDGIGPKNGFALQFIKSVADYYLKDRLRQKSYLKSSAEVIDFLSLSLRGRQVEVFVAIFLDSALGILDTEVVSEGTVNVNTVYPREIMRRALAHNAAALVVAHNHPSGALSPSPQDRQLTRNLYLLCSLMQVRLLDHIIVGDGHFSFADNGMMAELDEWAGSIASGSAGPNTDHGI